MGFCYSCFSTTWLILFKKNPDERLVRTAWAILERQICWSRSILCVCCHCRQFSPTLRVQHEMKERESDWVTWKTIYRFVVVNASLYMVVIMWMLCYGWGWRSNGNNAKIITWSKHDHVFQPSMIWPTTNHFNGPDKRFSFSNILRTYQRINALFWVSPKHSVCWNIWKWCKPRLLVI